MPLPSVIGVALNTTISQRPPSEQEHRTAAEATIPRQMFQLMSLYTTLPECERERVRDTLLHIAKDYPGEVRMLWQRRDEVAGKHLPAIGSFSRTEFGAEYIHGISGPAPAETGAPVAPAAPATSHNANGRRGMQQNGMVANPGRNAFITKLAAELEGRQFAPGQVSLGIGISFQLHGTKWGFSSIREAIGLATALNEGRAVLPPEPPPAEPKQQHIPPPKYKSLRQMSHQFLLHVSRNGDANARATAPEVYKSFFHYRESGEIAVRYEQVFGERIGGKPGWEHFVDLAYNTAVPKNRGAAARAWRSICKGELPPAGLQARLKYPGGRKFGKHMGWLPADASFSAYRSIAAKLPYEGAVEPGTLSRFELGLVRAMPQKVSEELRLRRNKVGQLALERLVRYEQACYEACPPPKLKAKIGTKFALFRFMHALENSTPALHGLPLDALSASRPREYRRLMAYAQEIYGEAGIATACTAYLDWKRAIESAGRSPWSVTAWENAEHSTPAAALDGLREFARHSKYTSKSWIEVKDPKLYRAFAHFRDSGELGDLYAEKFGERPGRMLWTHFLRLAGVKHRCRHYNPARYKTLDSALDAMAEYAQRHRYTSANKVSQNNYALYDAFFRFRDTGEVGERYEGMFGERPEKLLWPHFVALAKVVYKKAPRRSTCVYTTLDHSLAAFREFHSAHNTTTTQDVKRLANPIYEAYVRFKEDGQVAKRHLKEFGTNPEKIEWRHYVAIAGLTHTADRRRRAKYRTLDSALDALNAFGRQGGTTDATAVIAKDRPIYKAFTRFKNSGELGQRYARDIGNAPEKIGWGHFEELAALRAKPSSSPTAQPQQQQSAGAAPQSAPLPQSNSQSQ